MGNLSFFDSEELSVRSLSLTRLCMEISQAVTGIGKVAVEGEVVKPTKRPSGWTFFTLADRAVSIQVALAPRRDAITDVVHGERVRVIGAPDFVSRRGQLNLRADEVLPVGDGAIARAIAEVRKRLEADGILSRPRKPIPPLPAKIGVICGAKAAVKEDIEAVVAQRFPGYPVEFRTVPVSGSETPSAVVEALRVLEIGGAEVIIVARGGGDPATLLPFSDESLCRAIANSPVPVVVAIGHEGDRPLCDEVADLRCGTPSLAAVAVVPDEATLRVRLESLMASTKNSIYDRLRSEDLLVSRLEPIDLLRTRLDMAGERLSGFAFSGIMAMRFADSASRLARSDWTTSISHHLERSRLSLSSAWALVSALDPQGVLSRGYSVVVRQNGGGRGDGRDSEVAQGDGRADGVLATGWTAVRSSEEIAPGDSVLLRFAKGSAAAVVDSIETEGDK